VIPPRITEKDLEKQIQSNPQNPSLYYTLYELHIANDNSKAAKKTIAKLIKKNPDEAKGYYLMGRIQYKQRDMKAAEKNLRKVFELQNKVTVEEYVLLEAKIYEILTVLLRGDKNRAYKMYAEWSNVLTEERVRYFDLDEQDRGILQGIFKSNKIRVESSVPLSETDPAEDLNTENVVPLDQVDTQPVLKERFDPKYTSAALKKGITGQVIVNLLISETGDVIEVKVIQELPGGLSEETVKAVRQWKYEPAVKDGQKVKVWKRITITFK
jgi:TonB family protein